MVVGSGGAGKSTLAVALGRATGLPVVHLDRYYWRPGWQPPVAEEWRATVRQLVAGERWIMDGNYSSTFAPRLARADTLIFLDRPRHVCLWNIVQRRLRHAGRARPDMNEGCREQLSAEFVAYVWGYPTKRRPAMLARLEGARRMGKIVLHLRTRRDIAGVLALARRGA
jgi:adenylate kinase family enzyme